MFLCIIIILCGNMEQWKIIITTTTTTTWEKYIFFFTYHCRLPSVFRPAAACNDDNDVAAHHYRRHHFLFLTAAPYHIFRSWPVPFLKVTPKNNRRLIIFLQKQYTRSSVLHMRWVRFEFTSRYCCFFLWVHCNVYLQKLKIVCIFMYIEIR